jgi:hypothetical protein
MMRVRRKKDSKSCNHKIKSLKEGPKVDWNADEMKTLSIVINIMESSMMTMMNMRTI